jgi:hypothetical protein
LEESVKKYIFAESTNPQKDLFMEIDNIIDELTKPESEPYTKPVTTPTVKPDTKEKIKPNPRLTPFRPKPGTNPKPKA